MNLASTAVTGGTFKVSSDSLLQTSGNSSMNGVTVQGSMSNIGNLTITARGLAVSDTYTQTSGQTRLDGSTLTAKAVNIQGGILSGNGDVFGTTTVNGTLSAGDSPGILNFHGTSTFDGNVIVEIAGVNVDGAAPVVNLVNVGTDPLTTDFDQYNVFADGTLLAGLLFEVTLLDGFTPTAGSFFDVFTADDLIADLDLLEFHFPTFGDGSVFVASLVHFGDREALRFTVVSPAAVPEPSMLGLLMISMFVLFYIRRGRPARR